MLPLLLLAAALQLPTPKAAADAPTDPLAPLMVYTGAWTVHVAHPWSGGKPGTADHLVSHCTHNQAFLTCEQVINGKPSILMVFMPSGTPGKFYTRTVTPEGLATPRGELAIAGDRWTYLDKSVQGDKTTWYRVENTFKDRDHIHYEEYESTDNKTWTKTNEGDEARD